MSEAKRNVNEKRAVELLMELLSIEGPSGRERDVALRVRELLVNAGLPEPHVTFDDADSKIPGEAETGNLIARLPGEGRARLLVAHLDTIPLAVGVKPKVSGLWVTSDARTALGADDRGGVAALVATAETLLKSGGAHPPITLLFTVREEGGTWGARCVDMDMLGEPEFAFSFDGREPDKLVVAAPSSDKFTIFIRGRESHAGTAPEKGVSAVEIAALAISTLREKGWIGKIERGGHLGTSNVGAIEGGVGTNVVMGELHIQAEARSHEPKFLETIVKAFKSAFRSAAKSVTSADRKCGSVHFKVNHAYHAFSLSPDNVAVVAATEAVKAAGLKPSPKVQNGGLDACWLNEYGIPTVTLGTGTFNAHTKQERLNIPDYLKACRVALELATRPFDE